jgi:transcriptional regulator with XRE-family HTH domain
MRQKSNVSEARPENEAEDLGKRLRRFREERGLTQYKLGKLSELDPGYIARIESGAIRKSGLPVLRKVASGLQISLYQLIGEEEISLPPPQITPTKTDKFGELKRALGKFGLKEFEFIGEMLQVPNRGCVRAGTPCVNEQEEGEAMTVKRNLIESLTNRPQDVYSLLVSGESLAGDGIHTGDTIYVLQTQDFDIDGKLYVIRDPRTGESVVRHLYNRGLRISIEASNPDYEPLLYDEVEVIGRMIYRQPMGEKM